MKFCKNCQVETERYSNRNCKKCHAASALAYRLANPQVIKDRNAAYRAANSEKIAAYCTANFNKMSVRYAKWRAENKEKRREYDHNRRARKRNAGGTHSCKDISEILTLQKSKCPICNISIKDSYHVDHVMPLAKGGSNDRLNIQLLCPSCNHKKSDRHPVDFMQSRGFLL